MSIKSSKIGTLEFRCVIRERNSDYFYGNCTELNMKKITKFLDRYNVDFVPRIGVLGVKVKFNNKTNIDNKYTSNFVTKIGDPISGIGNSVGNISTNTGRSNIECVDELISNYTIVDIIVTVKMNRCKIKTGTSTSITFLATYITEAKIDAIERDLEKMRLL